MGADKAVGGDVEILQLWLNLFARRKMTEPRYGGLQKNDIPELNFDDGRVTVNFYGGKRESG